MTMESDDLLLQRILPLEGAGPHSKAAATASSSAASHVCKFISSFLPHRKHLSVSLIFARKDESTVPCSLSALWTVLLRFIPVRKNFGRSQDKAGTKNHDLFFLPFCPLDVR